MKGSPSWLIIPTPIFSGGFVKRSSKTAFFMGMVRLFKDISEISVARLAISSGISVSKTPETTQCFINPSLLVLNAIIEMFLSVLIGGNPLIFFKYSNKIICRNIAYH